MDNNRNRNLEDRCDNCNVEFGTLNEPAGMSREAKMNSQAAAQKYRNQNQGSNMQSQYKYEFGTSNASIGTGYAQKGYNALGKEAKQGTDAYKNEFGSANPDFQARSQEAAKQMRNYQPKQNQNQSK